MFVRPIAYMALSLATFTAGCANTCYAQTKIGSDSIKVGANEEISTPQLILVDSVDKFLDASKTRKLITAQNTFEMFGWLLNTSKKAKELPADQIPGAIKSEVYSMKKTYRFVTDDTLDILVSGVIRFHNSTNKPSNNKDSKNTALQPGELLLDRAILCKAGQFCNSAAMTTEQTISFAKTLMGTDPQAIRHAVIAQRDSYETESRAYNFGTKLDELIGSYIKPKD